MPRAATIPCPEGLTPEIAALIEALARAQVRREDRAAQVPLSDNKSSSDHR